jgi:hypothetical protein
MTSISSPQYTPLVGVRQVSVVNDRRADLEVFAPGLLERFGYSVDHPNAVDAVALPADDAQSVE